MEKKYSDKDQIVARWISSGRGCKASSVIYVDEERILRYRGSSATGNRLPYPWFDEEKTYYGRSLVEQLGKKYSED